MGPCHHGNRHDADSGLSRGADAGKKEVIMRKTVVVLLVSCLTIISLSAFAARECRGASDRAYEQAGRESEFHRARDWVATREKSEKETNE